MAGYNAALSEEVTHLLNEAERQGSCLAAKDVRLRRALRRRAEADGPIEPYPSVFARKRYWQYLNPSTRARHVLLAVHALNPGWVFCGASAALVLGIQLPYPVIDDKVHVILSKKQHRANNRQVFHHVYHGDDLVETCGIVTTGALATVADCLCSFGFRYGTVVADSALRDVGLNKEVLLDFLCAKRRGFRGVGQARRTAGFADGRSANGGESVARAVMHELGFVAPELQVEFREPIDMGCGYFADFCWGLEPGTRLVAFGEQTEGLIVGELDGYEKYFDAVMNKGEGAAGALLRERRRESRLTIMRAPVVRFSYREVLDTAYFDRLLGTYGVPRDHAPLVEFSKVALAVDDERVPLEVYGV